MFTSSFLKLFPIKKPVIAMVHVFAGDLSKQTEQALEDTARLEEGGVDGLLVENYGWGYDDADRATEAASELLGKIALTVRMRSKLPVGLNVLPNDYRRSFSIARSIGGSFVQLDHVTGRFQGCESVDPHAYSAARDKSGALVVLGGIHPKYYELTDQTCSLAECAKRAAALADAVVITGQATGGPVSLDDLRVAREAVGEHPLIIGSGLRPENAWAHLALADGAIVGSAFKTGGVRPGEHINAELVRKLMDEVARAR